MVLSGTPDPDESPEYEPKTSLVYYRAYRADTTETLAEGCAASVISEGIVGEISIAVPLGVPYVYEVRFGSRPGQARTERERQAACEQGPTYWVDWFEDPRCLGASVPTSELLLVDMLDDGWNVVPLPTGDKAQRVTASTIRLVVRSDAAGPVGFYSRYEPCNGGDNFYFLAYTVEALDTGNAGADLESSSSARGEAEFE